MPRLRDIMKVLSFFTILFFMLQCLYPPLLWACTLWAAAGSKVKGEGTLIAKNRDWRPNCKQVLKLITPDKGFRYYGLFEEGNEESGIKMGINEHGLVVISARAIISKKERQSMSRTQGVNRLLLTSCATIEDALKRTDIFEGARFLLMADKKEIALAEIGITGGCVIDKTDNGVLYHTNHFVEPGLMVYSPDRFTGTRIDRYIGSVERYEQIHELMHDKNRFEMRDFIEISQSQNGGPDRSIWRKGTTSQSIRTLSSWIVYQPRGGKPVLYIRIADPGEDIKERLISLPEIFKREKR